MNEVLLQVDSSADSKDHITVVIADDHPLMREALRSHLEKETDIEIVAGVGDGEEAVEIAIKLLPDVVIMDITMPKLNGLEANRQIKEKCPNTAVIVLTVHSDSEHILKILEAGAAGYLVKSIYGAEVYHAIRMVAAGESALSGEVLHQLLKYSLRNPIQPFN